MKQKQLGTEQMSMVLRVLGYIFDKQKDISYFNTIKYKDEVQAAFKIIELREKVKAPECNGVGVIAPVLPNPAFLDVVGDELEFDDCLFD